MTARLLAGLLALGASTALAQTTPPPGPAAPAGAAAHQQAPGTVAPEDLCRALLAFVQDPRPTPRAEPEASRQSAAGRSSGAQTPQGSPTVPPDSGDYSPQAEVPPGVAAAGGGTPIAAAPGGGAGEPASPAAPPETAGTGGAQPETAQADTAPAPESVESAAPADVAPPAPSAAGAAAMPPPPPRLDPPGAPAAQGRAASRPQVGSGGRGELIPASGQPMVPALSVVPLAEAERLAEADDLDGCRSAVRELRFAGVPMPAPLLAFSALDDRFYAVTDED